MPVSPAPGRLQQDGCLKFGAASTTLPKQDNRLGAACENPRLGKLTLAVWQRMISKRPTQDGEKVGNKTTKNKEGCLGQLECRRRECGQVAGGSRGDFLVRKKKWWEKKAFLSVRPQPSIYNRSEDGLLFLLLYLPLNES